LRAYSSAYSIIASVRASAPERAEMGMTMGEANATIIRKTYANFAQGNIPAVFWASLTK
jgi:hypothetical protein